MSLPSPQMNEAKPIRPLAIAACAALLVLVLNIVLRVLLKLDGMPSTMGVAFGVGGLVAMWFSQVPKRAPTQSERSRFLWWYAGLLALPSLAFIAVASVGRSLSFTGLFIVGLHLLAYPAAAQFFLSEKRLNAFLAKKTQ